MALSTKQRVFVNEYLIDYNATQAAIRAGYSEKTATVIGWENLRKPYIAEIIEKHIESVAVGRDERLVLLSEIARDGEKDSDRLSAIEKLGKLAGDYINKVEHSGDVQMRVVDIDYGLDDDE